MFERFATQASTYAGDIDGLILLILVIVGFWFILAEGVFFWLILKFRAKPGVPAMYITGEEKHQKKWISTPHNLVLLCDVAIIVGAIKVWVDVKQTLPPADEKVKVVAQQWAWSFHHPGADKILGTADDVKTVDELRLKEGVTYHFEMESKDVLHSFSIPAFRLKQDVIPGRTITAWAKTTKAGTFDLQCAEICGIAHGIMRAKVVIESPAAHAAWLDSQRGPTLAATSAAPEATP